MSLPRSFPLRSAGGKTIDIPSVGFGTWAAEGTGWTEKAVAEALKAGYRHLDCAWLYGCNGEIGAAIKSSGIPRSEIFITTKFWPNFAAPENVETCLDLCLEEMGLEYVDLYLAHWPHAFVPISKEGFRTAKTGPGRTNEEKNIKTENGKAVIDWEHTSTNITQRAGKQGSFVPTWKAMQQLVKNGKTRMVGLSNFSVSEIRDLLPHQDDAPISCDQIECHPWLPQEELLAFGKENQVQIVAWSPFAGQKKDGAKLLEDPTVLKLAKKNGMDVGQLLQSWAVQRGTVPLGKSQTPSRIKSNLEVMKLDDESMKALDGLKLPNGEGRTVDFTKTWGVQLFQN